MSQWGSWSTCTASCGGGSQARVRNITVSPQNGGTACPATIDSQNCNAQGCSATLLTFLRNCYIFLYTFFSYSGRTCELFGHALVAVVAVHCYMWWRSLSFSPPSLLPPSLLFLHLCMMLFSSTIVIYSLFSLLYPHLTLFLSLLSSSPVA